MHICQAKKEVIDITKNILLLSNRKWIVELNKMLSMSSSSNDNGDDGNGDDDEQQYHHHHMTHHRGGNGGNGNGDGDDDASLLDTKASEESFYHLSDQVMQKVNLWKYGESYHGAGGTDCGNGENVESDGGDGDDDGDDFEESGE